MPTGIYNHKRGKNHHNFKHGKYCKTRCLKCNKEIKQGKMCLKCRKLIRKLNAKSYKKYYCKKCKKEITWQTWFYGKKRCQKCFQKGKLNPRYGKHWTKAQLKKRSKILHKHHIDCNHYNNKKENIIYLTQSGHMKAHGSIFKLIANLLKRNIIKFNKKRAIYQLKKGIKNEEK